MVSKTVKVVYPLKQGLKLSNLIVRKSSNKLVKVVYPLKQGLKHRSAICIGILGKVKVVYPLKQGLKLGFVYHAQFVSSELK